MLKYIENIKEQKKDMCILYYKNQWSGWKRAGEIFI